MKSNKYYLFFFLLSFFFINKSIGDENVSFLSLKNSETNLRQGPSFEYPIRFTYKKKYLPVQVLDKSENWLKTRDFEYNSGWIHISQLSKKKSAINIEKNAIMYKNSTIYSEPIAKLEIGRLVIIKKCKRAWCKIKTGDYNGWTLKKYLWGIN